MAVQLDFGDAEQQRLRVTQEQQEQIQNLYKELADCIAKEAEKAPRVPSDALRAQYLRALEKQIRENLHTMQGDLRSTIKGNMSYTADSVIRDAKAFLGEYGLPVQGAFSHVPADIVQSVMSGQLYAGNWTLSRALWLNTAEIQKDVHTVVAQGIIQNKSAYDIAKDLEKYVDPSARKDWEWSKVYPGTRKVVDYNAQRLARTMVSHAYQQAFVRTTQKNPFVTQYRWLASNSDRTCEICEERDNQLFDKDSLPLDHPNGMCTFEAVIDDDAEAIADRLADWAYGEKDPELDTWAEDLYGKEWMEKAAKSSDTLMERSMEAEFKKIDAALDRFLHSDGKKPLEEMFPNLDLPYCRVEKYPVKELIDMYVRPLNDNIKRFGDAFTYWDPDDVLYILYKDSTMLRISPDGWDETKKVPLTGIDSIIVDAGWGTAVAGKNVRLYNWREEVEYGRYGYRSVRQRYEDDNQIRAEFKGESRDHGG